MPEAFGGAPMDMPTTDCDLTRAIAQARLDEVDDRGLMPLEEARAMVANAREFTRGRGRRKGGAIVLDSDRLWAALLSLKDAREFVRHCRRLRWLADPRGENNINPFERYGAGILPWLADHVDSDGNFTVSPSCLRACLLAVDTRKAFDLLWRIRQVDGSWSEFVRLFNRWMRAHPRVGFPRLADLAAAGDRRAKKYLRHLANRKPDVVHNLVAAKRGDRDTDELFDTLRIVSRLTEASILNILDLSAERELETEAAPWPLFTSQAADASVFQGMRLIAARAPRGNGWGVAFERLTGTEPDNARIEIYRYGSHVSPGLSPDDERPIEFEVSKEKADGNRLEGVVVRGPAGPLKLTDAMVGNHGLKIGGLHLAAREEVDFVLRLRAYLARYPDAFWTDPLRTARLLGLGPDVEVVVAAVRFMHVLGSDASDVPGRDKFWLGRPSETRVYRSLARALVERDASYFKPGKSNLDWR